MTPKTALAQLRRVVSNIQQTFPILTLLYKSVGVGVAGTLNV